MTEPSERLRGEDAESAAKATAPRVALDSIVDKIFHKEFIRLGVTGVQDDGILTICVLTMRNGFFITGQSAPASPVNFDAEFGRQLAYDDAIRQAWRLEGYLLREQLWRQENE